MSLACTPKEHPLRLSELREYRPAPVNALVATKITGVGVTDNRASLFFRGILLCFLSSFQATALSKGMTIKYRITDHLGMIPLLALLPCLLLQRSHWLTQ
jgi:hypothetical protein